MMKDIKHKQPVIPKQFCKHLYTNANTLGHSLKAGTHGTVCSLWLSMFVSDLRPDWGETENREDQCPGLNHSPSFAIPMLWTGRYLCTCALGSVLFNYISAHSKCEREKPRKKSQFLCWRGRTVPCCLTLISNKTVLDSLKRGKISPNHPISSKESVFCILHYLKKNT